MFCLGDKLFNDEEDGEEGVGQFEACAGEEAEEGAPGGAEGIAALFAGEELSYKGTDERPYDDTQKTLRTERQTDDGDYQSDIASPNAGLAAAVPLGAPRGDDIVEDGDDGCRHSGDDKERWGELGCTAKVYQQEAQPAERGACQTRDNRAQDSDKSKDYGKDNEEDGHLNLVNYEL